MKRLEGFKNKNKILYFYFLNKDYSVTIKDIILKCKVHISNVRIGGSVSQNFDILLSCVFKK